MTSTHCFRSQGHISNDSPSFLGINVMIGARASSVRSIIDETIQLSVKMCVADAVHDNTVNENVQTLQSRVSKLLEQLGSEIPSITDRAAVEKCVHLCRLAMDEIRADVLSVETETIVKSEFSTQSTVGELFIKINIDLCFLFPFVPSSTEMHFLSILLVVSPACRGTASHIKRL